MDPITFIYEHGDPPAVLSVWIAGDEFGPVLVLHDSVTDWTIGLSPGKAKQLRDLINTMLDIERSLIDNR